MEHNHDTHDHGAMDHSQHPDQATTAKDYFLFATVIAFVFLASYLLAPSLGGLSTENYMRLFMGVFFAVFGIFKLLDLKGFATSYIGYDIIARNFTAYAYAYPFLELLLALGYFLDIPNVNYATVVIMAVGSIGVTRELLRGSKIKCACLGTYIKLPLTTISLIENLTMGAMALILLIK